MRTATARPSNEQASAQGAGVSDFATPEMEQKLLQMDLAELNLPRVNDLNVDALKLSWLERLFGRR